MLSSWSKNVHLVNWHNAHLPWQYCTHGDGLIAHGRFAGTIEGKMLLVFINAHLKWVEAIPMGSNSTASTIQLWKVFAQFVLPTTLVLDNGPQYTAQEFQDFSSSNGIKHIWVTPYYPSYTLTDRLSRATETLLNPQVGSHPPNCCLGETWYQN